MSGFISFGGGGVTIANRADPGEEVVGGLANGGMTQIDSDAAANAKGSYVTLGTPSGNTWYGVYVTVGSSGGNSANNACLDVSFDGGSTAIIKDIYLKTGDRNAYTLYLPLNIATSNSASSCKARIQCSSTSSDLIQLALRGELNADSQKRPLFDNMVSETISLSGETAPNTSGSAATIGTGAGAYAVVAASLSQSFGCLIPVLGQPSGAVSETMTCEFTVDANGSAAGSGTLIATRFAQRLAVNPTCVYQFLDPIYHQFTAGQQVSMRVNGVTGGGAIRCGLLGFY